MHFPQNRRIKNNKVGGKKERKKNQQNLTTWHRLDVSEKQMKKKNYNSHSFLVFCKEKVSKEKKKNKNLQIQCRKRKSDLDMTSFIK